MRLGQLSRKVNIKPTEILSYLKNEFDIELGSHLNTKVDDALAEKVIAKYTAPVDSNKDEPEIKEPNVSNTAEKVVETTEVVVQENTPESSIKEENETSEIASAPVEFEAHEEVDASIIKNAELIQAPKIELSGPKVVGKIELPPSLEEQMVEIDGVMISKAELANRKREERKEKREKYEEKRKSRSSKSARKSRIKSEAQLEQIKRDKEAEEMAKRLERREKRIAAKKKEQTNAKSTFVPKPIKKKAKLVSNESQTSEPSKPEPTTWYGKLWKWFNT